MVKEFDFYIVPTPIGNLKDITLRAIEVLKAVDVIACEDTRTTQKILNHYEIKTKCVSYHKFNENERIGYFLELIKQGKKLALVSDAGTPLICDPGSVLVKELRKNNVSITSLAGPCAVSTFLSQVSRTGEDYSFIGFLPKSQTQITDLLTKYAHTNLVFYDSPNRLLKTLEWIKSFNETAVIAVGRELTKMFEEIVIDNVSNVIEHFTKNTLKGEIVAMVLKKENKTDVELKDKIEKLKQKGFSSKDISVILSTLYDVNKNDVYKIVTNCP